MFERYIEPFAGSASLFFAVRPKLAVLADMNADLLQAYEMLRSHPRRLHRAVSALGTTNTDYYNIRDEQTSPRTPMARAARFVYLNRFAFNGVYRTNRDGKFNVPRGSRTGDIPSEREFTRNAIALRGAALRTGDFITTTRDVRRGDFVYLDPPYSPRQKRHGEYGYGSFTNTDEPRLFELLNRIEANGATFLLSYARPRRLPATIAGYHIKYVSVPRSIAGFAARRTVAAEILVSNRPFSAEM